MNYVNYVPPLEPKVKQKKSPDSIGQTLNTNDLISDNKGELIEPKIMLRLKLALDFKLPSCQELV